jgi:peptidoglycan/LPS O-acetylase OafA/YrhL
MNICFLSEFSNGRDNNLNLIRMVAATGVLVSHAWPVSSGDVDQQPLSQTLNGIDLGNISVYVFFAISGYLVAQSFVRSGSLKRFWSARALRIFPGLLVALLITALIIGPLLTVAAMEDFWRAVPSYVLRNVTLFSLQQYLPGVFSGNPVGSVTNIPLWTLKYELTCYAALMVLGVAGVLKSRRLMIAAALVFLLAYTAVLYFQPHQALVSLAQLALPFLTGVCFFVWRDRIPLSFPLGVALVFLSFLTYKTPVFREVLVFTLTYCVFLLAYLPGGLIRRYNRIGDYSYGIYIYAFPIQQIIAFQGVTDPLTNILLAFPLTLGCAGLSWWLIEKPALALVRRLR